MTILDCSNLLFEFFLKNDCFNIEEHTTKLLTVVEDFDAFKATLLSTLEDFKRKGIVEESRFNDKAYYILKKGLSVQEQNIKISGETAMEISYAINGFCEDMEGSNEICNPSEISEADVKALLAIIRTITGMGQEECGEDGFICPDCLKEMQEEKDTENLSNELTDKDD